MTRTTKHSLTAMSLALFGIAAVGYANQDGKECNLGTLPGSYVFAANGYNIVGGVAQPKAIIELIDFDGDGTLSVPGGTRSLNGAVAQIQPGGGGTYTLEENCTGTLAFTGGPSFDIYLSPHHAETIWMFSEQSEHRVPGHSHEVAAESEIHLWGGVFRPRPGGPEKARPYVRTH